MKPLGRVSIVRADARALPLPDASVDLIVTSPPYWSLRSYTDGGEHYDGQIGAEATPAEYLANLWECTREWMRVLKPGGSIFVNLSDKYEGSGGNSGHTGSDVGRGQRVTAYRNARSGRVKVKSLIGLPWRYALGCVDDLDLILRAEIIWSKPDGMPESVTDRVRRSHETWFHFTKQQKYFTAVDEIREPHSAPRRVAGKNAFAARNLSHQRTATGAYDGPSALGKLPGSVWEVAAQPLTVPDHLGVDHFAAFPSALPLRIIAGWSPSGICTACGEGRRPVVDRSEKLLHRPSGAEFLGKGYTGPNGEKRGNGNVLTVARLLGYACACDAPVAPTRPALVVDPFGGTGTTALAARALGRDAISFDLSADYCRLARWRTSDPGELARVLGKPKPPKQVDGQLGFDLEAS